MCVKVAPSKPGEQLNALNCILKHICLQSLCQISFTYSKGKRICSPYLEMKCVYVCVYVCVCVRAHIYVLNYFRNKFAPRSEINLTKLPFGDIQEHPKL